jgi:hypothetical protein
MKRVLKILGIGVLVVVLGVLALIGALEFFNWRDRCHLDALVATLSPGSPFSAATGRLGQPQQVVDDPDSMRVFRMSRAQTDVPGPRLNLFVHRHWVAFYWVLVFTDSDSKTILHAEWNAM